MKIKKIKQIEFLGEDNKHLCIMKITYSEQLNGDEKAITLYNTYNTLLSYDKFKRDDIIKIGWKIEYNNDTPIFYFSNGKVFSIFDCGMKCRCYPNKEQEKILTNVFGQYRWMYNQGIKYALSTCEYNDNRNIIGCIKIDRHLRDYKYNFDKQPFDSILTSYLEVGVETEINQTIKNYNNRKYGQYNTRFKNGIPTFRSKKDRQSVLMPYLEACEVNINDTDYFSHKKGKCYNGHFIFKLYKKDPMHLKIKMPSNINIYSHYNVHVIKEKCGEYYVTFTTNKVQQVTKCFYDWENQQLKSYIVNKSNICGIDVGIKNFVTDSNGKQIQNPTKFKQNKKKVLKYQKQMSRRDKGFHATYSSSTKNHQKFVIHSMSRFGYKQTSHRYEKARLAYAKAWKHIVNQRLDFQHKLSTNYINDNQVIVIEDLKIANMLKNHNLAGSIAASAWYQFYVLLNYKAQMHMKEVYQAQWNFPSSKACSHCGYIKENLKLSERIYECPHCSMVIDRDENAAINIKEKYRKDRHIV